jgi:hypothetical protein
LFAQEREVLKMDGFQKEGRGHAIGLFIILVLLLRLGGFRSEEERVAVRERE